MPNPDKKPNPLDLQVKMPSRKVHPTLPERTKEGGFPHDPKPVQKKPVRR